MLVFPRLYVVILTVLFRLVRLCGGSKADLVLENVAFRHQVEVLKRGRPRSSLTWADRALWVLLRRWWPRWREALEIVKPGTVERWHRVGLSGLWRRHSKKHRGGRPRIGAEIRDLIRRMARDNFTWGAPRIHGELLMLGFTVSERTVSRYMQQRPRHRDPIREWMAFLRNHQGLLTELPADLAKAAGKGLATGLRRVVIHQLPRMAHAAASAVRFFTWLAIGCITRHVRADAGRALPIAAALESTASAEPTISRRPARCARAPPSSDHRAARPVSDRSAAAWSSAVSALPGSRVPRVRRSPNSTAMSSPTRSRPRWRGHKSICVPARAPIIRCGNVKCAGDGNWRRTADLAARRGDGPSRRVNAIVVGSHRANAVRSDNARRCVPANWRR